MDNNRNDNNDDDHPFFPSFGGFEGFGGFNRFFRDMESGFFKDVDSFFQDMFQDMNGQFEDMTNKMDDGFRNFGQMRTGFHPPSMSGNAPPLDQNPRDQMLKGNAEESPTVARTQPLDGGRRFAWTPQGTSVMPGDNTDGQVAGTSSFRFFQTIRHGDGTVERVEKTTKDGRTCTTVTKTDPNGISTTTTTCDRPAIEGAPMLTSPDSQSPSGTAPPDHRNTPNLTPELNQEDASFFSKLFGNFGSKPKS